jgi:ADP-ribose pyrophosphatase
VLHRGKFIEFRVDTVERADGSRATRDFAGHPGAVAIVALDAEGRVALVRQWRLAADDALLEIPAGGLDLADDGSKEAPERAARRELEEETGMRAATWRKLGAFYSAPGFTDELMHLYIATDLTPASADGRLGPDEDERLILEWRPWQEAVAATEQGEIRDAKSIVGLLWLARVMDGESPAEGSADAGIVGEVARATYRMTMREIVVANVEATRRSTFARATGVLTGALGLFGVVMFGDPVSYLGVLLGLSFVTGWFAAPFVWYQARRRPDLVAAEWRLTADERGLNVESAAMNGLHRWSVFRVVHETSRFFFLDTAAGLNMIVPKRAFESADLAIMYRLFDRHGLLRRRG